MDYNEKDNNESKASYDKTTHGVGLGVALGAGIGTALGAGIGAVLKDVGIGVALGAGIGTALGAGIGMLFGIVYPKDEKEKDNNKFYQ